MRGAYVVAALVVVGLVWLTVDRVRGQLALSAAMEDWRASGEPVELSELPLSAPKPGHSPLELFYAIKALEAPERSQFERFAEWTGSLSEADAPDLAAADRDRINRLGRWFFRTADPTFMGAEPKLNAGSIVRSALEAGIPESVEPVEIDLLELILADRQGSIDVYRQFVPLGQVDALEALADVEAQSGAFGFLTSSWGRDPSKFIERLNRTDVGRAYQLAAVVEALKGAEPLEELEALWAHAQAFEGVPFGFGFDLRRQGLDVFLESLAYCAPVLGPDFLARSRQWLEGLDLASEWRAVLVGERCRGHRALLMIRGELTVESLLPSDREDSDREGSDREDRVDRQWLERSTSFSQVGPGAHADYLRVHEERIAALDELGLVPTLWAGGELVREPEGEPTTTDILLFMTGDLLPGMEAQSIVGLETRRRLAICGLAWLLDGEPGLEQALVQYPDPFTGGAFERVDWDGEIDALKSNGGGQSNSWALRPSRSSR